MAPIVRRYQEKVDYLNIELPKYIKKIGHFPTLQEIQLRKDLYYKVHNLGGLKKVAEILDLKLPNRSEKKYLYQTSDAHIVRSSMEALFDNFLYINNIKHEPDIVVKKSSGKYYRCDFKVLDEKNKIQYIEIWGWEEKGQSEYNKRKARKKYFYKKNNIQVKSLNSKFFYGVSTAENIFEDLKIWTIKNNIKTKKFKKFDENFDLFTYSVLDKDYLISNILSLCKKLKRFPSYDEIKKKLNKQIFYLLVFYGGSQKLSKELGYSMDRIYGNLTNDELLKEFEKIVPKGYMPTRTILKKKNAYFLHSRIINLGGFAKARERLKLKKYFSTKMIDVSSKSLKLKHNGKLILFKSRTEAAKYFKINYFTFNKRLNEGVKMPKLISKKILEKKEGKNGKIILIHKGKTHTFKFLKDAAEFFDIKYLLFRRRFADGWKMPDLISKKNYNYKQ